MANPQTYIPAPPLFFTRSAKMDESSVDVHRADSNRDDWHSVTDAKKRKQIQDRLAQRARRKRLREGKKDVKQTLRDSETQSSLEMQAHAHCRCVPEAILGPGSLDTFDLIPYPGDFTISASTSSSHIPSFCSSYIGQPPTLSFELPCPLTVFGALYINGQILGLTCNSAVASKSPPVSPDVPLPLHPTPTQLVTVHFNGIDRFPFPKMRDNFITVSGIMDIEAFSLDLFTIPSFSITPGAASWDPRAWKIEKTFAAKWGFLFYC